MAERTAQDDWRDGVSDPKTPGELRVWIQKSPTDKTLINKPVADILAMKSIDSAK